MEDNNTSNQNRRMDLENAHKNLKPVLMIYLIIGFLGIIVYLIFQNYSLNKQVSELNKKVNNSNVAIPSSDSLTIKGTDNVVSTDITEKQANFSEFKLVETREYFESSECSLSVHLIDGSGNKLSIEGSSDNIIENLPCGDHFIDLYDEPYEIQVSEWSTVSDSFIICNGQDEYGTNILTKYIVENGLVNVSSEFNINDRLVGYIPSLKYILTDDFKIYDTNGDVVTVFEALPSTGEKRNTFLVKNEETFLITSRIENEETYTEYFYLFNPSTAGFYLAGSETYQAAGLGCPKGYMTLDRDTKILSGIGCLNKTASVELKF